MKKYIISIVVSLFVGLACYIILDPNTETEINPYEISVDTGMVNTWVEVPVPEKKIELPMCYDYREKYNVTLKKQPALIWNYSDNTNMMIGFMKKNGIKLEQSAYEIAIVSDDIQAWDRFILYSNWKSFIFTVWEWETWYIDQSRSMIYYATLESAWYSNFWSSKQIYWDISSHFQKWDYMSLFQINSRWASPTELYIYFNDNCKDYLLK